MQCETMMFLDSPSAIQIKEEVAHIVDEHAGVKFDRAMSVRSLERQYERIGRALERYRAGDADIIIVD